MTNPNKNTNATTPDESHSEGVESPVDRRAILKQVIFGIVASIVAIAVGWLTGFISLIGSWFQNHFYATPARLHDLAKELRFRIDRADKYIRTDPIKAQNYLDGIDPTLFVDPKSSGVSLSGILKELNSIGAKVPTEAESLAATKTLSPDDIEKLVNYLKLILSTNDPVN